MSDHDGTAEAFGAYLFEDLVRIVNLGMGIFLILLAVRVAYLRFQAPVGDRLRDSNPWGLLSYALFAAVPTLHGFASFGTPLDVLFPIYTAALVSGVLGAFAQVSYRHWMHRRPKEPVA